MDDIDPPSAISPQRVVRHAGAVTSVRRTAATRIRLAAAMLPLVLAGGVLAGCGNEADNEPTTQETAVDPSETPTDAPTDTPTDEETPVPGADSRVVKRAIKDLAEREKVDASEIQVVAVEDVTWSDSSLGCAKPGKMYTQALVEGQRITLRIGDADFAYHAAAGKDAGYCAKPTQ